MKWAISANAWSMDKYRKFSVDVELQTQEKYNLEPFRYIWLDKWMNRMQNLLCRLTLAIITMFAVQQQSIEFLCQVNDMLSRQNVSILNGPFATRHQENRSATFEITFILQISLFSKPPKNTIVSIVSINLSNRIEWEKSVSEPFGMCVYSLDQSCPISGWSSVQ